MSVYKLTMKILKRMVIGLLNTWVSHGRIVWQFQSRMSLHDHSQNHHVVQSVNELVRAGTGEFFDSMSVEFCPKLPRCRLSIRAMLEPCNIRRKHKS